MKFDYKKFKANLAGEKSILLQKYEAIYGSVENLEDTSFFSHYLSMFCFEDEDIALLNLSDIARQKHDWKAFVQLASASFFTEFNIKLSHNGKIDFEISFDTLIFELKDTEPILRFLGNIELELNTTSSKLKVTKKLSELSDYQINAFFEIYILERMSSSVKSVDETVREAQKLIGMTKIERYDCLMDLVLTSLPPDKMKYKGIKKYFRLLLLKESSTLYQSLKS